jgi:hypothetical protein
MRFRSPIAAAGLAACVFLLACPQPTPPPNNNSATPTPAATGTPTPETPTPSATATTKGNPERLIDLIQQLQHEHVRDSFGVQAGQCFTDKDLARFKADRVTAELVGQLKDDKDFLAIVDSIRGMGSAERTKLLDRAQQTYKKTWAELGYDPATSPPAKLREGQTDAGQEAERSIAEAVVELVRQKL